MTRKLFAAALGLAILAPAAAQTPSLEAAFAAGQIGERYDGYLGVAGTVSASVRSQVATINVRRRSLYTRLAGEKRVAPQEVGITAGCQLLENTRDNEVYLLPEGGWRLRRPGQKVELPPYCK